MGFEDLVANVTEQATRLKAFAVADWLDTKPKADQVFEVRRVMEDGCRSLEAALSHLSHPSVLPGLATTRPSP